ncbi:MAG: M13 family metallopeptidase [Flavobacterium sp.]|nr:M13 family metallopeptidase [Flavobacterium sp.]
MRLAQIPTFLLVTALALSCTKKETQFPDPLLTHRDTTTNPADDFFQYANGGWFKQNPIPTTESSNGIFQLINDTINSQIKKICERSAATRSAKGSNKQKIGDFYASGMDSLRIEQMGIQPIQSELKIINACANLGQVVQTFAFLHRLGMQPGFTFYVAQDDKNSTKNALFMSQGGLSLGNRDYYFNTDAETVKIRSEFPKHVAKMFELTGVSAAKSQENAARILALETDVAKFSRKLEDLRDPNRNYNKMTMSQFQRLSPAVAWNDLFPLMGIAKADSVIVGQPEFFKNLDQLLAKYTVEDWKVYLKWNVISSYAPYLNSALAAEDFRFFSTEMKGVTEQKPRWKRVVNQTNSSLGELIGQVYVAEYLPKGSKEKLLEIGNSIREVYAERIKKLDWMSETTKTKALHKLNKIVMKVGYPDKWKDLSALRIDRQSYCSNVKRSNTWEYNQMIAKFGKPVDRNEWVMQPQTYNAYYNPSNNEIVVPACNIIVPGFEGRMPDDAILYGIIGGSTFGHEITHGFDDQGSQYDEKGNLNNWWTAEDLAKFQAKTKRIVNQFNAYSVLGDKHVNGDATQGENIADLGGVIMGYEAFKKTKQYKTNQLISGLNPNQRYFLAYAYAWMVNIKKEALAQQIMVDVHAPAKFRINGPLSNMPEFYQTFGIKPGNLMHQPDSSRVVIW